MTAPLSAQDKASWNGDSYQAVGAVPHRQDDATLPLSQENLEIQLAARVAQAQPDRSQLGYSEVVVRDVANSVVKEIVGVFESLLDRLLTEKKESTIRSMVAELVTEDVASTIATGREQLKDKEFGHLIRELARLREDAQQRESEVDQRFKVFHDLSELENKHFKELDDKLRSLDARSGALEDGYVPKQDLRELQKDVKGKLGAVDKRLDEGSERHDTLAEAVRAFEGSCRSTYATKLQHADVERRVTTGLGDAADALRRGMDDLQMYAAAESEFARTREEHQKRLASLDAQTFESKQGLDAVNSLLHRSQQFNEEMYATKLSQREAVAAIDQQLLASHESLAGSLQAMQDAKADKAEVEESCSALSSSIGGVRDNLRNTTRTLGGLTTTLGQLQKHCDDTFMPLSSIDLVLAEQAQQIKKECDTTAAIATLSDDVDKERERLRQLTGQVQHLRTDLVDSTDELHNLSVRHLDLKHYAHEVNARVQRLDDYCAKSFNNNGQALALQRQDHDNLMQLHQVLRDEVRSQAAYQKAEGEQIRGASTHRYMEQLDKGLALHRSLEKIEQRHTELSDSVRGIKLPKV